MKRRVLEYVTGRLKGMFQIVGVGNDVASPHLAGPFRVGEEGQDVEFASLIKVKPTYILYREVPDKGTLTGRLGDYMPGLPGNFDSKQV